MAIARKGIVLAGGIGSRLWPLTIVSSKQLLPVYDKPMIYYPLTTLMMAGIREILLISTGGQLPLFQKLLGDGSQWGVSISYAVQDQPRGIAEAFLIGADFVDGGPSALILGDNLYYGAGLIDRVSAASKRTEGATIFCYQVQNPEQFGVVELDASGVAVDIQEKPRPARSKWAVTGLYFYDESIVAAARSIKPSARGELEVTDVNRWYLERGQLHAECLGRGFAWFDAGTHQALLQASEFIYTIEERQGLKVGSPEEVAYRMGFIGPDEVRRQAASAPHSEYGAYLTRMLETEN